MQSNFFFYFLKKFDPTCNNNTGRAINYDSLKQMTTMYLALPLTCFFFLLKRVVNYHLNCWNQIFGLGMTMIPIDRVLYYLYSNLKLK
jgi:hypothetical protein